MCISEFIYGEQLLGNPTAVLAICDPETTECWTNPMTKDCHNKILAVLRPNEHEKTYKTQRVSTDISQNPFPKLFVAVTWSPIPVNPLW